MLLAAVCWCRSFHLARRFKKSGFAPAIIILFMSLFLSFESSGQRAWNVCQWMLSILRSNKTFPISKSHRTQDEKLYEFLGNILQHCLKLSQVMKFVIDMNRLQRSREHVRLCKFCYFFSLSFLNDPLMFNKHSCPSNDIRTVCLRLEHDTIVAYDYFYTRFKAKRSVESKGKIICLSAASVSASKTLLCVYCLADYLVEHSFSNHHDIFTINNTRNITRILSHFFAAAPRDAARFFIYESLNVTNSI